VLLFECRDDAVELSDRRVHLLYSTEFSELPLASDVAIRR
jgi:hypothetical protein